MVVNPTVLLRKILGQFDTSKIEVPAIYWQYSPGV